MSKERAWQLIAKKLAGEASGLELVELEELLRGDPDLHYALENVTDIWNLPLQHSQEAEQSFSRHSDRLKARGLVWTTTDDYEQAKPPVRFRGKWYIISSGLLVVLAVIFYFQQNSSRKNLGGAAAPKNQPNEISTRYGSRTKISLPDGSLVWLNSGSNLIYDKNFGNGSREVSLSGEAFFDVKHDANHPFIIHTKEVDIKVLGTTFNVKSYPAERKTETSLIRGRIEVTPKDRPEKKMILKPDEKLVVTEESNEIAAKKSGPKIPKEPLMLLGKINHYDRDEEIIVETAWVDDKFVFNNEPFKNIAENMQRWYNVEIKFIDPKVEQVRFTGRFDNETIQQALDALSINREFTYSVEGNKVFIKK